MNFCEFEEKIIEISRSLSINLIDDFPSILTREDRFALERYIACYLHARYYFYKHTLNEFTNEKIYLDITNSGRENQSLRYYISNKRIFRFLVQNTRNFINLKKRTLFRGSSLIFAHHVKYLRYIRKTNLDYTKVVVCILGSDKELIQQAFSLFPNVALLPAKLAPANSPKFLLTYFETRKGIEALVEGLKPNKLVCFEGDAAYCSSIATIGKTSGISTYCMQWGVHYPIWREVAFSNMEFDYFISWGRFFSEELKAFNPNVNFIERSFFTRQNHVKRRNAIIFLDQNEGGLVRKEHRDSLAEMAVALKKKMPKSKIIFRLHPSFDGSFKLERYLKENGVEFGDNTKPLIDELQQCWAAVSIYSSGVVEALAANVIPVLVNTTCHKSFPIAIGERGLGIECRSFQQGADFIYTLDCDQRARERCIKNIANYHGELFSENSDLNKVLNT